MEQTVETQRIFQSKKESLIVNNLNVIHATDGTINS